MALLLALPVAARTRPHYGGTVRVEIQGDPWQRPNSLARRLVFDGLTSIDDNGAVRPALATEWESDDSGHRWQFKLRKGVHFHDGTALTATSVVSALNATCGSACPWSSVRAAGSSVVFVSDAPSPELPALLASDQFRVELSAAADGRSAGGSIGTGPFQVNGFANGVLRLIANDDCWQGRPFAGAIEIRVHRPLRDQWLDLNSGRADLVEVPAEMIRAAQQQKMNVTASRPVELLALQVSDAGALANPLLRLSIAAALDRNAISNVIFQKQGWITGSLLPQGTTGYSFLFATDRDLNRSHELRGGQTVPNLSLRVEGDEAMQLAAQRIALDLHAAGFSVQVANSVAQTSDLTLRKFVLEGGEPGAILNSVLFNAGETVTSPIGNPAEQFNAEKRFIDRHVLVPLLFLPHAYASGPRVRDLRLDAAGYPQLADVSLEDAP